MPFTRIRQGEGIDAFAADVRNAVLTGRAALQVLVEVGAPAGALSFCGHSAGGAVAAILSAVEPRPARIGIFGNGAGALARSALARALSRGGILTQELTAVTEWFDLARFVAVQRRAPLLIQHGRTDRIVPMQASKALFNAPANPKRWAEYDCGHGLDADPHARNDREPERVRQRKPRPGESGHGVDGAAPVSAPASRPRSRRTTCQTA